MVNGSTLSDFRPTNSSTATTEEPLRPALRGSRASFGPLDEGGGVAATSTANRANNYSDITPGSLGSSAVVEYQVYATPSSMVDLLPNQANLPINSSPITASVHAPIETANLQSLNSALRQGNLTATQRSIEDLVQQGFSAEAMNRLAEWIQDPRTSADVATRLLSLVEAESMRHQLDGSSLSSVRGAVLTNYMDNNKTQAALSLQNSMIQNGELSYLRMALLEGGARSTTSTDLIIKLVRSSGFSTDLLFKEIIAGRVIRGLQDAQTTPPGPGVRPEIAVRRQARALLEASGLTTEELAAYLQSFALGEAEAQRSPHIREKLPTIGHVRRYNAALIDLARGL